MLNKVFQVGFNKCGTTSLHHLFSASGYRSVHWHKGDLGRQIYINITTGQPVLSGISHLDCFFDMEASELLIYGHRYYEEFFAEYPCAYFILNTRDKNSWLRSRANHMKGVLITSMQKQFKFSVKQVFKFWSLEWEHHHRHVRRFFAGKENFLEFNLDTDSISKLIDFVGPEYLLDSKHWRKLNETKKVSPQV